MIETGLTLKSTDHSQSQPESEGFEVTIFPYRVKDGEIVEWMLHRVDTKKPHGDRILNSCRICGDYEAALRASKYVFKLKKRRG